MIFPNLFEIHFEEDKSNSLHLFVTTCEILDENLILNFQCDDKHNLILELCKNNTNTIRLGLLDRQGHSFYKKKFICGAGQFILPHIFSYEGCKDTSATPIKISFIIKTTEEVL